MWEAALVALGGAAGSLSRWYAAVAITQRVPAPLAATSTLTVNLLGALLIGVVFGLVRPGDPTHSRLYLLLATGFLGGFTTFSTLSLDVIKALEGGQLLWALLYVMASLVGGIVLCGVGVWLGRMG